MNTETSNQDKNIFLFIKGIARKRVPRWASIVIIAILAAPFVCFLAFLALIFGGGFLLEILPATSMPFVGILIMIMALLYLALLIAWFVFAKNKSLTKFFYDAVPFLFLGAVLYFWSQAYSWEHFSSESWSENPELSNLSALLEYAKALAKTVMLGSIVIVFRLYLKRRP